MTFSSLEHSIRWIFLAHAIAGGFALITLVVPLISKKGGSLHTKTGWFYTGAMVFVGLSAFVITPWRFFFDPQKTLETENFSVFLFYISVFTLSAISYGLSALKQKKRHGLSRSVAHIGPPLGTIGCGLLVQALGWHSQNILLMTFPFLGHVTSITQLYYWLTAPREKMHWWYAHMNGMIVACIATITAFLVTAIPRIWPGPIAESPLLWISPGLILGTLLNRWAYAYKKKFER